MLRRKFEAVFYYAPILIALSGLIGLYPAGAYQVYYNYDGLGRLSHVCNALPGDGEAADYGLDPAGNRRSYGNVKTDIALYANDPGITSANGRFHLLMQDDGNLVLYRNSDARGLWSTNTVGTGASVAYFQSDGNFVLYNPTGVSFWNSNTANSPCGHLSVQDDGNMVIYNAVGQMVWASNTAGS